MVRPWFPRKVQSSLKELRPTGKRRLDPYLETFELCEGCRNYDPVGVYRKVDWCPDLCMMPCKLCRHGVIRSIVRVKLWEFLGKTVGTDPIAVLNYSLYSRSTLIPHTPVGAYSVAVNADNGDQTPSVKSISSVLQFPSFGAHVCVSPPQSSIKFSTSVWNSTWFHIHPID